ncbi:hypothetical protein N7509_006080 [Penicillium cosmopolitanum]|uniref:Uncharacterized protein n=1 Tax=Penicillium cosmopolitanum TaxID=1131564 RepID=A0A9X0BAP0_9EURO|nr:uncharacterized protein N7509_006080 [Penicillium cosmopolitanum]KAJ5397967.1 hypothetical protein N7509_006080 [Penicillium cosmopolitanum]
MLARNLSTLVFKNEAIYAGLNGQPTIRALSSASPSTTSRGLTPDNSKNQAETNPNESPSKPASKLQSTNQVKSIAQADAELRERMERMSGEGGAAGVEYEDGKPSAMKRGVRNNMFRLI